MSDENNTDHNDTNHNDAGCTDDQSERPSFAAYLRDLRKRHGLSQAQLAAQVGLSGGYFGFFEQGRYRPPRKIIWKLARVLKVDCTEMLAHAGYQAGAIDEQAMRDYLQTLSVEAQTAPQVPLVQVPSAVRDHRVYCATGDGEEVSGTQTFISTERQDWALECIRNDPDFMLAEPFKSASLLRPIKALLILRYQTETGRRLLTPEESMALSQLIHD